MHFEYVKFSLVILCTPIMGTFKDRNLSFYKEYAKEYTLCHTTF